MNIPCNVVRDLLPLYYDSVCSEESRELFERHLKTCQSCRKELETMDNILTNPPMHPDDSKTAKIASAAWKKSKRASFIKGIAIALAIVFLFTAIFVFPYTKQGMHLTVTLWERQLTDFAQSQLEKQGGSSKTYPGLRMNVYPDANAVFFECTGMGYSGFVYSADDIPIGFQGMDMTFETHKGGWIWEEPNGDNWMYVERITDQWFWYEMHF